MVRKLEKHGPLVLPGGKVIIWTFEDLVMVDQKVQVQVHVQYVVCHWLTNNFTAFQPPRVGPSFSISTGS